jgi:hypothetical protein
MHPKSLVVSAKACHTSNIANRMNRSIKRGLPYLRKTLFVLMSILLKLSQPGVPVYEFLDRKHAEGKPFHVYMTAGANKFLRIYYGRMRGHLAGLDTSNDLSPASPQ